MTHNTLKPASNKAKRVRKHCKSKLEGEGLIAWHKEHPLHSGGRPRKHGAYLFLKTGIIPEGKIHLAEMADAAVSRMADDLGGLQNLSGGQVVILREIRQLLVFKFLIDERIMSAGLFKPGPLLELQAPLNGFYLAASNSIQRGCERLGLKKVTAADDLESYLKRNYGKGKDSPAPVIESGKPLTKGKANKRSSIVEASREVKHGKKH